MSTSIYHQIYMCFNTQPPEGGWLRHFPLLLTHPSFNTQPPEGGWSVSALMAEVQSCFNTQPPEGGWILLTYY